MLIAESYRARLAKLVGGAIRSGYAPLLEALPRLAAAMEAQRTDSTRRGDASPVDESTKLAGRAAQEFGGDFAKRTRAEVKRAAENVAAHTKGQLRKKLDEHPDERVRDLKLTDGPRLKPIIEGFAAENVALITGISPQLASQVQALVVQGLTSGVPHERLARQIRDRLDVSARRAEMIAVDQVGKLNGQLSAQRAQDLGVTHFFWRSLDDERVRGNPDGKYPDAKPSHWDRNGKRYAYVDPPKGKNGEPEMPGTAINCRCYADPDLSTLTQPGAPTSEGAEVQAEPAPAPRSVDDMEAEAARMMAEVEELLARQQAEIEERMRPPDPPPAPPPQDEQLDDPAHEAQAQGLVAQLASAPPAAAETALARYRRWKRRGRQVRGDQLRADYNPDQPRAPDGRFGEVAGKREGKADPESDRTAAKRERQTARAQRVEAARSEATHRGRMMAPDQWEGWKREAAQEAEDAEYEIESATDDLRDAEDDEEREAARARLIAAADARSVARARESAFHDLMESSQGPAEPQPDDDADDDEYEPPSRPARKKGYDPLSPDVVEAHAESLAAVDEEIDRGMATTPHPRVSISSRWAGRTVGLGSLPDAVPVEELSRAFAPPEGFTATVVDVSDKSISMTFQDADGKDIGKIVRDFRPNGEVHHSLFVLNKDVRGAGFADQVLGQSLLRYEKLGIKKVTVDATWVGRYKWATVGFRFDSDEAVKQIERFIVANVASEETRQQVRDLLDEPWNLARFTDGKEYRVEFQAGPGNDRSSGRFHLGKALLLQDRMPPWAGVLDVDRNNEGYLHALSKLKVETL